MFAIFCLSFLFLTSCSFLKMDTISEENRPMNFNAQAAHELHSSRRYTFHNAKNMISSNESADVEMAKISLAYHDVIRNEAIKNYIAYYDVDRLISKGQKLKYTNESYYYIDEQDIAKPFINHQITQQMKSENKLPANNVMSSYIQNKAEDVIIKPKKKTSKTFDYNFIHTTTNAALFYN